VDRRADRGVDPDPLPVHRIRRAANRAAAPWLAAALGILLVAAALRLPLVARDVRFHPDEALFATFGRRFIATGDPLLSGEALDKPPLLFFTLGGARALWGGSEFAARLPACFASLMTVAALLRLGRRWYGASVAMAAGLLLAVSPLDRAFAATAFSDPPLTLCIVGAALAAACGCGGWAGLLLGVAFAFKPTALQWLPLVALLVFYAPRHTDRRAALVRLARFSAGFGALCALLALWSAARATTPDFWALNAANNNPGRLIRAAELAPRLAAWGAALGLLLPALPLIGAAPLVAFGWLTPALSFRAAGERPAIDLLLTAYTLGTLALLWLVAFNTYHRYLHTVAPFLLLLLARALVIGGRSVFNRLGAGPRARGACLRAATLLVLIGGYGAPIGDPFDGYGIGYQQIDRLATALNALPPGAVVYEHWIGWELRYYMGAAPQTPLIWLPSVDALMAQAAARAKGAPPIYLTGPQDRVAAWSDALTKNDYTVRRIRQFGAFDLIEVAARP
jgi:4-amino-4-deoxy-L-arabinose transferase-like glycosyltransferase